MQHKTPIPLTYNTPAEKCELTLARTVCVSGVGAVQRRLATAYIIMK